jgi:DNA-binding PadR family transcriptional regulator
VELVTPEPPSALATPYQYVEYRHVDDRCKVGVMEFRMPSYIALATLIDGPLHGYAIVRRAAELSDGDVRPSTGTLYALLERAIAEGLVVAGDPYLEGGRERRDYSLTQHGRSELEAETRRLERAARTVSRRLRATAVAQ